MDEYSWQEKNQNQTSKRKSQTKLQQNYDDDFEEQNNNNKKKNKQIDLPKIKDDSKKTVNQSKSKSKKPVQDEGSDEIYENDFQQPSFKKIPQKESKGNPKNETKSPKLSPQAKSKTKKPKLDSNIEKSPSLSKHKKSSSSSNMKQSNLKQGMEKKASQAIMKNNSIQIQSKYINYLNTQFPHTKEEVAKFAPQKINRLNEKLRSYIKKVNDQLTDLINENMRLIKTASLQPKTQEKSVQDVLMMLNEQKRNGQTYIETVQKQCYNLSEQWNKIKNEDLQRNTDQQIRQISQKIKQHTKEIGNLKYDMHQEGNKLNQEHNLAQKIVDLKSKLAIIKKEESKYADKIQKCDKNFEDLTSKNPQIDIQLKNLFEQAKRQNITLNFNALDKKKQQKYDELKKKAQNIRLHKQKTQSLSETKTSILKKDIDNLNTQISDIEKRFAQIDIQLHSTQQSSVLLIQEAKQKKLQPYVHTHLDFIYKNIKQGNPMTTITLLKPSRNSKQKNIGHISSGMKKSASAAKVNGFVRSQSEAELKPTFHITKKDSLDLKTKEKVALKLTQKSSQQRVWKGQSKEQNQTEKSKQIEQPNSSKPFIIRRSQNVSSPAQQTSKKNMQATIRQSEQKENQKSTNALGPKKMFKKAQNHDSQSQPEKKQVVITEKNANQMTQVHNESDDKNSKPQFKIKKAKKQIIQIPDEDLYLFPPGTQKIIKGNQTVKQITKTSPKNQQLTEPTKQQVVKSSSKGPNFKLGSSKSGQSNTETKVLSKQNHQNTFLTNIQNSDNKVAEKTNNQQKSNNLPAQDDTGLNIGGRRQVQRKIQRKNQDSYVV